MIKKTMMCHDFRFDNQIYQQKEGGFIGLSLTRDVAKIYMIHWDKQLIHKVEEIGMKLIVYKRYTDDINVATEDDQRTEATTDREVMEKI